MNKDGTRYLVLCSWKSEVINIEPYWEIVRWGTASGLSREDLKKGWITQAGFALRMDNCTFEEVCELEDAITAIRHT